METLYAFPYVHKHKLIKEGKLVNPCCVCENVDPFSDCYHCPNNKCTNFCFCFKCAKCTDNNEMLKLHNHILKPINRQFWTCNLCRRDTYQNGISMCCPQCDFDCCVYCFWGLNKPQIIT